MKKILMVCEAFGGGVFEYVSQLCNDIVDCFDVYLAFSLRPQTPKDYKSHIDSRVHLIEIKSFCNQILNIRSIIKCIIELRRIEDNVKPEIIHFHSSIAGGVGRIAFSGKRHSLVYTPHGYAHILQPPGIRSGFFWLIEKVLGKRNCITLTCCESEDFEARKFCKKTYYIETGINLNKIKSISGDGVSYGDNRFTVYTLGRVCAQKRPEVFDKIAQMVPEARFIWIGNGELESVLSKVELTGWMPHEKALAMAKEADVYILCSCGEAISMSLIEAMYLKKLVLVSNVMGNVSVIKNGKNGYICETAEDYADRVREAMREYPTALVERAYQDVIDIYNSKVMREKYISFYYKI